MTLQIIDCAGVKVRVLEPSEGMALTNGDTYSTQVYLGVLDDPSNWWEIPEDEVPQELPEQPD